MLIHHYSRETGEYLSSTQPDADPKRHGRWLVPASSTTSAPPARTPVSWPFYVNGQWELRPDHRGRLCYRMDTGAPVEIATAGKTPEELGLTIVPPPTPRHLWIDGEWAVPPELIEREKRDSAMAEFERLMKIARKTNFSKADAYAAGLLSEVEIALFKAWATYQMDLVRVVENPDFPSGLEWPAEPDPESIRSQVEKQIDERKLRAEIEETVVAPNDHDELSGLPPATSSESLPVIEPGQPTSKKES